MLRSQKSDIIVNVTIQVNPIAHLFSGTIPRMMNRQVEFFFDVSSSTFIPKKARQARFLRQKDSGGISALNFTVLISKVHTCFKYTVF